MKPGNSHKFGMLLNLFSFRVNRLPMKAVLGVIFSNIYSKPTYVRISEHSISLIDLLRIENSQACHSSFERRILELNKSRLDVQYPSYVTKKDDVPSYKMLFAVRKDTFQQILKQHGIGQGDLMLSDISFPIFKYGYIRFVCFLKINFFLCRKFTAVILQINFQEKQGFLC